MKSLLIVLLAVACGIISSGEASSSIFASSKEGQPLSKVWLLTKEIRAQCGEEYLNQLEKSIVYKFESISEEEEIKERLRQSYVLKICNFTRE